MNTDIVVKSLLAEHLPEAAELFVAGYRAARKCQPLLPSRHEDAEAIIPLLGDLASRNAGVVAFHGGKAVGFLQGQTLGSFRGQRTAYVPEWAHAAAPQGRQDVYRAMYEAISAAWVADGCGCHLITVLANDAEVTETFFWLEFGMMAVDAVRGVSPVHGNDAGVEIRRAGPDDVSVLAELIGSLQRHLSGPPTFLSGCDCVPIEEIAKRLSDPAGAYWLAWSDGKPVAHWRIQGANTSAAYVINDPLTASITSAFTTLPLRGRGLGLAMLNHSIQWAAAKGYVRCAVDFESPNVQAVRFWLKHFHPVCYSLIRAVGETCTRGGVA